MNKFSGIAKKTRAKGYSQYAKDAAETVQDPDKKPSIILSRKYAIPARDSMKGLAAARKGTGAKANPFGKVNQNRTDDTADDEDELKQEAIRRRLKKIRDRKKPINARSGASRR